MKPRKHLTKSIFKIGLECPRKLFYLNKTDEYLNESSEDPFLLALARGGYQVGALAQTKYPNGIEIKTKNSDEAIAETKKHLQNDSSVLFEAAFSATEGSASYFVRSDLVLKAGKKLRLIEVKSKSFESYGVDDAMQFLIARESNDTKVKLKSEWASYIYDLAFQVFVARLAFPDFEVSASIMLVDKAARNPVEGLHQMFLVQSKNGKGFDVTISNQARQNFQGHNILKEIDLTALVNDLIAGKEETLHWIMGPISKKASAIADLYINNKRAPILGLVGQRCKKCEFRGVSPTIKSGFDECWVEQANIDSASSKQLSIDLWNFRKATNAINSSKYLLSDLTESDLGTGENAERQLLIVKKQKNSDIAPWFDLEALKAELSQWTFPLHFIDFETCMPAIPFKKDFPPYSEVAFQFSHHVMHENGRVVHFGEYIDLTPGKFPTFDFLQELQNQLKNDEGTIFSYSNHENSVLNRAIGLLERSDEIDKDELIKFFKTITKKKEQGYSKKILWEGQRNMVDLLKVLKRTYYSPKMGNSNSLKYVLPAIISESKFLQNKYSVPVYGSSEMPSKNFTNHCWIRFDGTKYLSDPYQELPPLFSPEDLVRIESILTEEESVRNGGAAMMAYCKSQFTEMSELERDLLKRSLLKYCELDTLAMVMLVEYWRSVVGS